MVDKDTQQLFLKLSNIVQQTLTDFQCKMVDQGKAINSVMKISSQQYDLFSGQIADLNKEITDLKHNLMKLNRMVESMLNSQEKQDKVV